MTQTQLTTYLAEKVGIERKQGGGYRSAPDPGSHGASQPEDHGQVPAHFQRDAAVYRQPLGSTPNPD
jgi:hypothetical protein